MTFEVGDIGPGGGIVFAVNAAGNGGLEVAPSIVADNTAYGCFGTLLIPNSVIPVQNSDRTLINGDEMRELFENANENDLCIADAAEATFAFSTNVADDWYLPSVPELQTILSRLSLEQLPRELPTAFWAASERTDELGYLILENRGGVLLEPSPTSKNTQASVLAIRTFGTGVH